MRSKNVGEFPGMLVALSDLVFFVGAALARIGSGLIWVPVTSKRFSAVPSGVHVSRVTSGAVVLAVSEFTSFGRTTRIRLIE